MKKFTKTLLKDNLHNFLKLSCISIHTLIFVVICNFSFAATFTVLNTNDSGIGSLRQAILDAEANANSPTVDAIVFDAAVSGTITPLQLHYDNTILFDGTDETTNHRITTSGLVETDGNIVLKAKDYIEVSGDFTIPASSNVELGIQECNP